MIPTVHMTPDGARNGFVSVVFQEDYNRDGKRARKEPWEVGGEGADATVEPSTAQGSGARSSHEGAEVHMAEEGAAAPMAEEGAAAEADGTEITMTEGGAVAEGIDAPPSEAATEAANTP